MRKALHVNIKPDSENVLLELLTYVRIYRSIVMHLMPGWSIPLHRTSTSHAVHSKIYLPGNELDLSGTLN
jgi:hypothetical protein